MDFKWMSFEGFLVMVAITVGALYLQYRIIRAAVKDGILDARGAEKILDRVDAIDEKTN